MEFSEIGNQIKEIGMPGDMKRRIIKNCHIQMEKSEVNKGVGIKPFHRTLMAIAAIAVFSCLTGVTVLAATGKLQGMFRDVFNVGGAVTSTVYEQATDEVKVRAKQESDQIVISVEFEKPNVVPYSEINALAIRECEIVDNDVNKIIKRLTTESFEINGGTVEILIPINELVDTAEGNYKLVIKEFIGSKKADQPLPIAGLWEVDLRK